MAKKTIWEDRLINFPCKSDILPDIQISLIDMIQINNVNRLLDFIRSEKEKSRREVIEEIGKFLRKHEEHIGWFEVHKDNWQAFKSHLKGGENGF